MRCPLRLKHQKRPLGTAAFGVPEQVEDFDSCLFEECAWWNSESKDCAIKHPFGSLESKIERLIELTIAQKK